MSQITTANFWKDVGYTDGCMELPATNDVLPTADLTLTTLNPTKNRMFSELRVPKDYVTMLDYSYMSITVDNNNGTDKTFYGWIDSVEMISDTTSAPITQVNWHVDLWRTYMTGAEFGSGMVVRRPKVANDVLPPQQPSYRFKSPGTAINLYQNNKIWWVIIAVSYKDANDKSKVEYRAVPIADYANNASYYLNGIYVGTTTRAMSASKIFNGDWDETWNLLPENILSVFLSPIAPYQVSGSGTSDSPISIGSGWTVTGASGEAYFKGSENSYPFQWTYAPTMTNSYMTDDVTSYEIRAMDGRTFGTLPWGIGVNQCQVRIVYSITSAYIQLRFWNNLTGITKEQANQYGLCFNIPLWTLDVTENTWSSYVYSGQRQYDMDQMALNTKSNAVSGGLSLGASALTGAASGAMLGSVVPGVGTIVGGVVGAVGGALTGAVSTIGNYAYDTLYKNDEMQRMNDYAHADQADRLLLPGMGMDPVLNGFQLELVPVSMDTYSQTQYTNDIAIYGAKVSEPTSDCSTLIASGGPLQIQNLIVKGDIPPMAKAYIKQRFAQGVIIG